MAPVKPLVFLSSLLVIFLTQNSGGEVPKLWCIADSQMPEDVLQRAMDWACEFGGANCTMTQEGQPCYLPNTLKDHTSYAFNSYYQRFKSQADSCVFGSAAMVTETDPSHDSCIFECLPWSD
ncbi:Glucan endo-1,3-beta-glucosidase 4 [Acorus calamus]|uniref:Glucan endo-1,3-beta-glucosidase 4 n=1 Tax=Acorus calamus TaxID=4465 RepID=A0AAV9EUG3_ACOCL|nr:Glucan endo-1,3-beta-glucosidase 4 [Acorus calamus]